MIDDGLAGAYGALRAGDWASARRELETWLADREDARARHALALACCGEARFEEACDHLARAVRVDPVTPRLAQDLSFVCARLGRWSDAIAALRPHVAVLGEQALLVWLTAAGRLRDRAAVEQVRDRVSDEMAPSAAVPLAYAEALLEVDRAADARPIVERVLASGNGDAPAQDLMARILEATGEPDAALDFLVRRAELEPAGAFAQLRLAFALQDRGQLEAGRGHRARAIQLGLRRPEDWSACLYMMLSDPQATPHDLLATARAAFGTATGRASAPGRRAGRRSGRLRIGYISAEFRTTPSFYFTTSFLARHDRSRFETFLYNCSPREDGATTAYAMLGEHWRHVAHVPEDRLREIMRADDLDVLVDLSGHFPHHRLAWLVDRVAPVQASYPHFPGTTGCPGIDWLLTDAFTSPPGTEAEYSERLWRLEPGYLAYTPPDAAPAVRSHPDSCVTFGVFQRLSKFNALVWDALAAVLDRVRNARLLLHNADPALDCEDSPTRRWIGRQFVARGVDPARVVVRGRLPVREHLELVGSVDVAPDTFPYAGQTTTCESLWMGVPVVSLIGTTHVSWVGAALLTRCGWSNWVTRSIAGYVDAAEAVADLARAREWTRVEVRERFVAAGLTDGDRVARALEAACVAFADGLVP